MIALPLSILIIVGLLLFVLGALVGVAIQIRWERRLDEREVEAVLNEGEPAELVDKPQTFDDIESMNPGFVPQFGMPETRHNYSGIRCATGGDEIRTGDPYVFIPLINGVVGSGIALCIDHVETVDA